MTYTLIDSVTLGSSASSVTFSSIDQSFGDLILTWETKVTASYSYVQVKLNADSGNNYSIVYMAGTGSTATSSSSSSGGFYPTQQTYPESTSTSFGNLEFMDYSVTDKHKSILSRSNNSSLATQASAFRWANTAAITTIEFATPLQTMAVGANFYLWGIAK